MVIVEEMRGGEDLRKGTTAMTSSAVATKFHFADQSDLNR